MEDFEKLPKMQDWSHLTVPEVQYQVADLKPNHNITFQNQDGTRIGTLDFNGPYMKFEGNAEESAIVFFNFVSSYFDQRLKDEFQKGYEAAKKENT